MYEGLRGSFENGSAADSGAEASRSCFRVTDLASLKKSIRAKARLPTEERVW